MTEDTVKLVYCGVNETEDTILEINQTTYPFIYILLKIFKSFSKAGESKKEYDG